MQTKVLGCVIASLLMLSVRVMPLYAQESLTLSVTPPLYQLNVAPGDLWKSSLKVINSNPYELTVYARVADLEPLGEEGQGNFIPREGGFDPNGISLASWIDVTQQPIVIPPEQSLEIPVVVTAPANAAPGGHFAAVLVGTQPPTDTDALVRTSQVVTSLFFLRVAGDVVEQGAIREFSVNKLFHSTPEVALSVRFENTGNVHIQPQGAIVVTNMWGKERGTIPINQKSNFGNVLPKSVRKFDFSWKGEPSLSDIGRYTAEVTLTYGQDERRNVSQKTYFWVIPVRGLLITLGVVCAFILFVTWAVRSYVRRALSLAGYAGTPTRVREAIQSAPAPRKKVARRDLALPLRQGVLDLRTHVTQHTSESRLSVLGRFVRQYKLFFAGLFGFLLFVLCGAYFFVDVLQKEKQFEVTIERGDQDVTLTNEDIAQGELSAPQVEQNFTFSVYNETGSEAGADDVVRRLAELDYHFSPLGGMSTSTRAKSVILYAAPFRDAALRLSNQLGGIPISGREMSSTTASDVALFVGEDMVH